MANLNFKKKFSKLHLLDSLALFFFLSPGDEIRHKKKNPGQKVFSIHERIFRAGK